MPLWDLIYESKIKINFHSEKIISYRIKKKGNIVLVPKLKTLGTFCTFDKLVSNQKCPNILTNNYNLYKEKFVSHHWG